MKKSLLIILMLLFCSTINYSQIQYHWKFDENHNMEKSYGERWEKISTQEGINQTEFNIRGLAKYVPGVKGSAIKFDGFSSYIEGSIVQPDRGDEDADVGSLAGKTFNTDGTKWKFLKDRKLHVFGGEAGEGKNGNYYQEGSFVEINIGEMSLEGIYDGKEFRLVQNVDGSGVPSKNITVEAWIAMGAYPWNWAPIITVGKYKVTGFYLGVDSRGRLGFHVSDATSVWHEANSKLNKDTRLGMELQKWHHVVGTYSAENKVLSVYINGKLEGTYSDFQFDYGIAYSDLDKGFRMGKNRDDLAPTEPIRDWATYPSRYTFDGIVDELKIHSKVLSDTEIADIYNSTIPENEPLFHSRRFPTVKSSGRFAANYTRLKFYPEWDALWPVGDYMDVVVQFDELPTKVMFWRGTRYSACQVSENGKWMADQSRETGNNWFLGQGSRDQMPTGCIEHMSDTQCRSSRVSIIEKNDARIVVNWRYLQMDVMFRQKDIPNETGFGEWGNELYYIYPDGITVRKVLPGYGGWQETILLNEPGTRPEDNIELEACTLLNLKGESKTYSWENGYPVFDLEDAVIQVTNFKSDYKPFMIFREGGGFDVFNLEVRPEYSHFPWWNHWPVAQTISDGRSANAPDRAAHSSLSWGNPNGDAALYGMTNQDAKTTVALAKSWNRPPAIKLLNDSYTSNGYEYTERAYMFSKDKAGSLSVEILANEDSPINNLALVINNWNGGETSLKLDGKNVDEGKSFRQGIEYDVEGNQKLIVFIKCKTEVNTRIELIPTKLSAR